MSAMSATKRLYLDYNATTPVLPSIVRTLFVDFNGGSKSKLIGNSSSIHLSGKSSRRLIETTSEYILNFFNLKQTHKVLFHSGATEGINLIVKGWALNLQNSYGSDVGSNINFYYSQVDHPAVWSLKDELNLYCSKVKIEPIQIPVNQVGEYQFSNIKYLQESNRFPESNRLQESKDYNNRKHLINFTYINNETGVVNHLDTIIKLKQKNPSLLIHVDAVQLLGKIENYTSLDSSIDYYTFSGHKFGALTGVGFTLIKKGSERFIHPLITGGEQQSNLRSGSENVHGIYSLVLALKYLQKHFSYEQQLSAKKYFENELAKFLGDRGEIVAHNAVCRDLCTVMFIVYDCKSDILQMAFDLAGIDVSRGSACKAQTVEASRVLLAMGYQIDMAKKAIRISFSTYITPNKAKQYFQKVKNVLERFVK